MATDEAIAALVDEATPPDVKRASLRADGTSTDHRRTGAAGVSDPGLSTDPGSEPATVVALAIETDQGHSLFLATREILEDLGKDLLERAAKMPLRSQLK